jgi:SAM-dependent methyltransferase
MTAADAARTKAIPPDETDRIAATVVPYLPPSLHGVFDARFTRSNALYDEFVFRLAIQVFAEVGLEPALAEWSTAEEAASRAKLDPLRAAVPVSWILRHLAGRGVVARIDAGDGPRFRAEQVVARPDPAAVADEQRRHDPACVPSYTLAEAAAQGYPAFLRGGPTGEEILLAPTRLPLWTGYFSNDNILYAVNNRLGAAAIEAWMPRRGGVILELGGGLASGAAAVLERLAAAGRLGELEAYRFTELVPAFLRRGQRLLQERFPTGPALTFASLDMNRPFAEQGVPPESVSVVYAVNTLHVAHDLAFTLNEVRQALEPQGQLVFSECIRPLPADTVYPEFVFNLLPTFRAPSLHPVYRQNGGFLTPEQWEAGLQAAGFRDVRMLPDIVRLRDEVPGFYATAIGATRPD